MSDLQPLTLFRSQTPLANFILHLAALQVRFPSFPKRLRNLFASPVGRAGGFR
jgi:hypothetical protein